MSQAQKGFKVSAAVNGATKLVTFKVGVILDDDGEPISGFEIVGKNNPLYQDVTSGVRIDNIQRAGKRGKAIDSSTEQGAKIMAETMVRNERKIAEAVIVNWFGFTEDDEVTPATFDSAIVSAMLDQNPNWVTLVNTALDTNANFMKV